MIRVDRNPQEKLSILPDAVLSQFLRPASTDRSSSLSPLPDSNSPHPQPEPPTSPPLPPAAEEREEPVKLPQPEEEEEEEARVEKSSRLSTPLSELSPAPDDLDFITDLDPTTTTDDRKKGPTIERSGSQASTSSESIPQGLRTSPFVDKKPPDALINGSAAPILDSATTKAGEYKIVAILELNSELFRLCMEFQKRGVSPTDTLYYQFSQRLQSNIGWLASLADPNRSAATSFPSLPIMEPPPAVDFFSCERIQQIYAELPTFFGNEIARRQQHGIPLIIPGSGINHGLNPPQKRERIDDILPDHANKRQNTGEPKLSPSQLMPPPSSIPSTATSTPASNTSLLPGTTTQPAINNFSLSLSNGPSSLSASPQHVVRLSPDGNVQAGVTHQPMLNSPENQLTGAPRARQTQMRIPQQQQQMTANLKNMPANMSGAQNMNPQGAPMGTNPGVGAGAGQGMGNASTGHSRITPQQIFQIMQNPNHPIMQHVMQTTPGFQSLPQQAQMQRVVLAAGAAIQNRNQQSEQQRASAASMQNAQQGMSMQINAGGMSFPMVDANSAQFAGMGTGQQNNVFSAGIQSSNPSGVGGPGGMSGVNMNNLNPQQRHLLLMQQQHQRGAANVGLGNPGVNAGVGAGANGSTGMMMNAQQMALSQQHQQQQHQQQQQQHQQQQQQQRMGMGMSSSMLSGSNDFPAGMRANNSMPGIARSARSPTDSTSNPIAQRVGRRASMGPEDYQRMMIKQQQQQQQQGQNPQATAMFGSPAGGGAAQGMVAGNWGGGQQGGMVVGGQNQMQNPQLQGIQNMQSMQGMQGMQNMQSMHGMHGMHNIQGMQGMQMQGGYAMSSPTQPQQQPQQHQQAQSAAGSTGLGGGVGSSFLSGTLSSSPPPMRVSSPNWGASTQHQHQHQAHQMQAQHGATISAGMSAGMGNMFNPFSSTEGSGGGLGELSGHMPSISMAQSQTSPDDYSGLFDWTTS